MTEESRRDDRAAALRFARYCGGYWSGPTARAAWFWTIALALSLVCKLGVDVSVNRWNRWFFDALERRDVATAGQAIASMAVIIFFVAAVGAAIVKTRETLQVEWREWVTARLLDQWIAGQRFFRMTRASAVANPEYRISDDARLATAPVVDFAIGLFTALLSASTFIVVLWSVGGAMDFSLLGIAFHVPAFMVFGAIIYGVTTSTLVPLIGRALPRATALRNEAEALFRSATIHLRENAETVAMTRAEGFVRRSIDSTYALVFIHWMAMVRQHVNVTWVTNANSMLIPIAPLMLATPKYLADQLTLGEVIQLASAFAQVQIAIGWIADNYNNIAEWFASARRISELVDALEAPDAVDDPKLPHVVIGASSDGALKLSEVSLMDPDGRTILAGASMRLAPGDRALVGGPPGAGRGVLARALTGFWPWGTGVLSFPDQVPPTFVGETPFLPEGSLAEAILCPGDAADFERDDIVAALSAADVAHLAGRLEESGRWMQTLSPSEKQRCAIARALLRQPGVIVIEDALSACDEQVQSRLIDALFAGCPRSIIIDISKRPASPSRYTCRFLLEKEPESSSRLVEQT